MHCPACGGRTEVIDSREKIINVAYDDSEQIPLRRALEIIIGEIARLQKKKDTAKRKKRLVPAQYRRHECRKCKVRFSTHENCPAIIKSEVSATQHNQ